ncbi:MAG TPA: MarR family transcriptional regulator [Acidimicrobiales bacterium]|nr:MarR family transcriptional regulator [Acidimicrobiales bacterium]
MGGGGVSDDALTDAILLASRAMVAVTVRSLGATEHEVTLPQYRTLVVLASGQSKRLADLAADVNVSPSTATRMCDRLLRKGLITRERDPVDRREIRLELTQAGQRLVQGVMDRRRAEVRAMLRSIPLGARSQLMGSLELLARSAGEAPDMHWGPGWHAAAGQGEPEGDSRVRPPTDS